jgi:hypothetical protein
MKTLPSYALIESARLCQVAFTQTMLSRYEKIRISCEVGENAYLWLTEEKGRKKRQFCWTEKGFVKTKRINAKLASQLIEIGFPSGN